VALAGRAEQLRVCAVLFDAEKSKYLTKVARSSAGVRQCGRLYYDRRRRDDSGVSAIESDTGKRVVEGALTAKTHTDAAERPAGEWNHMRIVGKDGGVTAEVNGVLVNRGTDATASSGQICLPSERTDVQYRYVRIKPE
jgi:hypothetical protein